MLAVSLDWYMKTSTIKGKKSNFPSSKKYDIYGHYSKL
jgi:hypothetical protein